MSITTHSWELVGSGGEAILGDTHVADSAGPRRGDVLLLHGFKGYKDYGFLPRLADACASAGWTAHRFNFSHSGMTRATETFERPDLFENDTWRRQVADVLRVASFAREAGTAGQALPMVMFGHSRGGVTAVLAGRELAAQGQAVQGVVTAAAPADAVRLSAEDREYLRREGRLLSPSGRTGQDLYVGRAWLEEIETDPAWHDPLAAAAGLDAAMLVLHGSADRTVDPHDAERYTQAQPHAQRVMIQHGSHVFDAPNPLPPDAPLPAATASLIRQVIDFLMRVHAER